MNTWTLDMQNALRNKCVHMKYILFTVCEQIYFRMTNNDALDIKMQMSVPDFLGFLQSGHAWQMYLDANPHTDHLARIEDR